MAVVGPKELEMDSVTVRSRFGVQLGTIKIDEFRYNIKQASH
ncbi:Anticodon-binding protein [Corchorus capsularis]|uniref:Anticodon-binding protein n=1 Tax=Corchorus capsularis TaxID=210143 RepID=A0A1R3HQL7_COCAP|nr:Anticodon-binding protein [Corchorus capsularis]